ncbi:head-tail connector protein [Bittarella massiliensis (ex Durand et al. 2017)]|uniref:head-tail connector protein n=1 Tax=Bittarella massiliensis (ex Durand et al. 2017) TaxID=1720313 RepID=UPI00073F29ED|nr:head-tail connector protein [Bittarella massiliensis (ex Durand et al. 2017)]
MLEKVKLALRITTTAFDEEISDLIAAAIADLRIAGIVSLEETDPLIIRAVTTYCRANFGSPDEYDRLKAAYDEQKAQLQIATGYTDWGDI